MPEVTGWYSALVVSAHWALAIGLTLRVIARRLPVGVSLAWIAVVFGFPFIGPVIYFFFSGKRLDRAWRTRLDAANLAAASALALEREGPLAVLPVAGAVGETVHRHVLGVLGIPALRGNRLILLRTHDAVFDAVIAELDAATDTCRMAFYIWHNGGRADDVVEAVLRASRRGVRCRILVDAIGSAEFLVSDNADRLRAAHVEVSAALPRTFKRRADLRYHRKNIVIDNRIAFTGSQNLVDPRFFKQDAGVGEWVDAVVRIEGPSAASLARMFDVDWSVETGGSTVGISGSSTEPGAISASASHANTKASGALLQVVPSGPAPEPDVIRQIILTSIYAARHSLTLTTPYFVPDEAVLAALHSAASRGVAVTLILPAKNDSHLVRFASASHFDELLAAGVKIARFRGGLLHTKSMVIDQALCLFGSVNLDMRSFWLDFEVTLLVQDNMFAKQLGDLQGEYLSRSVYVDPVIWAGRTKLRRLIENAARLAGPLL